MTRNPDAARLQSGVEVVRGDLTIPESLDECLKGVDAIFLVWTAGPGTLAAAIERIIKRVRRIVVLTSPHQTLHPFFQQPNPLAALHAEIERAVKASGVAWTVLRPGMFAANTLFWWAPQIRAGDVVRWPYADAPTAPIDERDIGAVAVRTLLEAGHNGADYVLTGPESLTQAEQVSTIGEVIGRQLRFEEMAPERARRELPFPESVATMLLDAWKAAVGQPAYVTPVVAEITGRTARTFRDWVSDNSAEFTLD
jgi:uncharacterized protein YbjT (DUF2867 family)